MLFSILSIFIVLSIIVFCHEFGHFFMAKACRVKVDEFGVGFRPRLWAFKMGGTEYSINAIPFGAFVKMAGIEDFEDNKTRDPKKAWILLLVSAAGPIASALTAFLLFWASFMIPSSAVVGGEGVKIVTVSADSPASEAGMQPGDVIRTIDGEMITAIDQVKPAISAHLGLETEIVLSRAGETVTVNAVPRANPPASQGALGVQLTWAVPKTEVRSSPPGQALTLAVQLMGQTPSMLKDLAFNILQDPGRVLMGPVGAAQVSSEMSSSGFGPVVGLAGALSLGLSIFNFIPLPPLDGGLMLMSVIFIARRGRGLPQKGLRIIFSIGWSLLIALMILVTYNDILRLIRGERILP